MTSPRYLIIEQKLIDGLPWMVTLANLPDAEHVHLTRHPDGTVTAVPMIEIDTRQAYGSGQYADGSVKYVHGDCIHEINESYNGRWEPRGYEIRLWVDIPEENRC
jgi:hypothetical protein